VTRNKDVPQIRDIPRRFDWGNRYLGYLEAAGFRIRAIPLWKGTKVKSPRSSMEQNYNILLLLHLSLPSRIRTSYLSGGNSDKIPGLIGGWKMLK
jgi:hypothetical protein